MGYTIPEDHHGSTPGSVENHKVLALDVLLADLRQELLRAETLHAPMNSPHEGWSVIFEELEELAEHVRADTGTSAEARKEALQVAAMGLRYALNLCQ